MWAYLGITVILLIAELVYFKIADHFNIIDKPNERSSHSTIVLRGGGVIFSLSMIVWAILMVVQGNVIAPYLPFLLFWLFMVFGIIATDREYWRQRLFFWRIIDDLFRCANYERSLVTDYYFIPFYIAKIIVVQIIQDQKDKFENMLIDRISNLHFLLRVLTANEGVLSEENKETLRLRCKYEWPLEKELSIKQMKEQTDYLDGYLEKVTGEKL